MLLKSIQEQDDWPDMLTSIAFAYRSSQHGTTHYEPIRLLIGRKPKLPAGMINADIDLDHVNIPDLTKEQVEDMEQAIANENIQILEEM